MGVHDWSHLPTKAMQTRRIILERWIVAKLSAISDIHW